MREYSIYIIKNNINDKVYIGQTCQSPSERFKQHMKPSTHKQRGSYKIYNAINKYGKENFYYEVLEEHISEEDINEREIYYINLYNSYEHGYNSTRGGDTKIISRVQDIQKLKEMFNGNKTYEEMAEYFQVNKATIQRTLLSLGLKRNLIITEGYLIANKDIKTNKQMAEELNVSSATISRAFKKYGITRGTGCNNHLNCQNQSNITKDDLIKYKHLPKKEIARILNISYSHVCRLFKKYEIK